MKKYIILSFIISFLSCSHDKVIEKKALIHFESNSFDLEELVYKTDTDCNFVFTNTSKCPLIIQNVETSCGCTTPKWTKKPVKPGKSGEIKVTYNADFPGMFSKTIKVFYNGPESPAILTIRGTVEYPEEPEIEENE